MTIKTTNTRMSITVDKNILQAFKMACVKKCESNQAGLESALKTYIQQEYTINPKILEELKDLRKESGLDLDNIINTTLEVYLDTLKDKDLQELKDRYINSGNYEGF